MIYGGWQNKETSVVYSTLVRDNFHELLDCKEVNDLYTLAHKNDFDFCLTKVDFYDILEMLYSSYRLI